MSAALRVAGAILPALASAFMLMRWTLVSDGFFWCAAFGVWAGQEVEQRFPRPGL